MALFSQRIGLKPVEKIIQKNSIDTDLLNCLWSVVYNTILQYHNEQDRYNQDTERSQYAQIIITQCWINFLKKPSDTLRYNRQAIEVLRDLYFHWKWNEVYDFLEYLAKNSFKFAKDFKAQCNRVLERENSAYRFVDNEIIEITSSTEINAINDAIAGAPEMAKIHLQEALSKLSDRKNPDFRNSIKESISAVETICRMLSGSEKETLGPALKKISTKTELHPAFEAGLLKLYGFTSDESGIRHSLMEESNLSYADAKFMLILCSGFCSYLLGKCAENNIKLKS